MWGNQKISWVILLMLAGVGMAQPADPIADAVEGFEKQVATAKKQFDSAIQRNADNTVKRLVTLGEGAARNKNEEMAGKAFKEVLRIDRGNAGARNYFQQRNKLDEVLTQLTVEWRPLVLVGPEGREQQIFYECMLGRYKSEKDWVAAVTLVVPDGTNIYSEAVHQRIATGSGDPSKLNFYSGTGNLVVASDGMYVFTGPVSSIKLNGEQLAEVREKPVEVPLKKGIYRIEVTAEPRYTEHVAISVVDGRSGQRLAIFNSLAQIKKFLQEPAEANGVKRFDVSRWSPEQAMPLRMGAPSTKSP